MTDKLSEADKAKITDNIGLNRMGEELMSPMHLALFLGITGIFTIEYQLGRIPLI